MKRLNAKASELKSFAIQADASIHIEAAAEGQPAKRPTFEINAYNGDLIQVGFGWPVVIDLSGLHASKNVPILLDHDATQIVGQAGKVTINRQGVNLSGVVTGEDEPAQKVISHAKNGFNWSASVGVTISKSEFVDRDQTAKANGKTFDGPLYIVRAGRLAEVSFVAVGADEGAGAKLAATAAKEHLMDFSEWLKANGWVDEKLTDKQKAKLRAAFDAENTVAKKGDGAGSGEAVNAGVVKGDGGKHVIADATATAAEPEKEYRKIEAAETRRIAAIRKVCHGKNADIEAKAIEENWSADKTELAVVRAERPKAPAVLSADSSKCNAAAIEAALCLRGGLKEEYVAKKFDQQTMNAAVSREYSGFTLHALMHEVIIAAGKHARPGQVNDDFIRTAFEADRQLRASGFSTLSLSGILSNVANKKLLQSFGAVPAASSLIASAVDHTDFKQMTSYRMTGVGAFQEVGPSGELKHISLSEESYTNQITTKGAMLTLTRTMQFNDDLGAFLQIPAIIGRQSALAVETAVFKLLLNSGSFFSTGNKNYLVGNTTALSISSLGTALASFRNQTDSNGDPIVLNPAIILVPPALEVLAMSIFKEAFVNETTTTDAGKPRNNPFVGMFRPATTPYLSNAALSGNSAKAWYLFADPADVAAVELAYLRGQRTPTIEQGEADFDTLGMSFRGFFDFGAAMQDPKAAFKAKGEA